MRYLSLILIVFVMWWTWAVVHSPAVISQAEHERIQTELKQVINNYITTHLPTAKNIHFDQFWTKTLNRHTIRASFSYTFDDAGVNNQIVRIGINGYAILDHKANSAATGTATNADVWSLDKLNVTNDRYMFLNGTLVKPGAAPTK